MWNGKKKAVTFSIDDGGIGDKRIIEIFNRYGIKGTFNLNSGLLGKPIVIKDDKGNIVEVLEKVAKDEVCSVYQNHEIAVHTVTHPNLTILSKEEIIKEVEEDRKALERLVGYNIVGMAYPSGGVNNDERVASIIQENTPIRYARTITSTYNFDLQENLLQFNPTIWWKEKQLLHAIEQFMNLQTDEPQLLYIWGHAFELDREMDISYNRLEQICQILSKKSDIFFGTNREVFQV